MARLPTLVAGGLCLFTGVLLLVWPRKTMLVLTALVGIWLVILGIVRVVRALATKAHNRQTRLLVGVSGLLSIVVGAVCLRNLFATVAMLSVIIGLVWIVGGVAEIAWRKRSSVLLGAASIASGAAVLFWPDITIPVMATVAGLWLAFLGALQLLQNHKPSEAR